MFFNIYPDDLNYLLSRENDGSHVANWSDKNLSSAVDLWFAASTRSAGKTFQIFVVSERYYKWFMLLVYITSKTLFVFVRPKDPKLNLTVDIVDEFQYDGLKQTRRHNANTEIIRFA